MAFITPVCANFKRPGHWLACWLLLCCYSGNALTQVELLQDQAAPPGAIPGAIVVEQASTHLANGVYMLNARIDYQFTPAVMEALENGVPLVLEVNVEVQRSRAWLWDEAFTGLRQRYQLEYHALTEQYLVKNLNGGTQLNFPSSEAAILVAGNIANLPLLDQHLLAPGESYTGQLSARLSIEALPTPLLLQAYLSPQWHLSSEPYTWRFQP